MEAKYSRRRAR